MFTGIIQNTSSPDLRSKMEKQKVPYFSLSTTYYKRPDRTLSVVSAEVQTLFKRPMASWMGYPSRYEGSSSKSLQHLATEITLPTEKKPELGPQIPCITQIPVEHDFLLGSTKPLAGSSYPL